MKEIITPQFIQEDEENLKLRPQYLNEYIGQSKNLEQLNIFISAAKLREKSLDHLLLYGPPGLGKTTLASVIANEMGVDIKVTSGPAIEKTGDLAAILSSLKENDILFIDEIHRLPKTVEEVLYPAMEDFCIDIVIGKGPSARSIRLDLPRFTLIGATTRAGLLGAPLRDRFGVLLKLELYSVEELKKIVDRSSKVLEVEIDEDASYEIASRSRGTPRIVNRLLKRISDYALVENDNLIDLKTCTEALKLLDIDEYGLDKVHINILKSIIKYFNGGPVGIDNIAATTGEEKNTIEDFYEPYLIQSGFLKRTNRGRVVLKKSYEHLGLIDLYNEESDE